MSGLEEIQDYKEGLMKETRKFLATAERDQ
jgi:hypothetical protein